MGNESNKVVQRCDENIPIRLTVNTQAHLLPNSTQMFGVWGLFTTQLNPTVWNVGFSPGLTLI